VAQVAAGGRHGLALKPDGTVWSWGSNGAGELGDGGWGGHRSTPFPVPGLTGVTQVAAGQDFSLALRSDGTVWAWGDNFSGQLGRGTFSSHELIPAPVTGLAGVIKISAGHDFALALRSDGTVGAWGDDFDGQLASPQAGARLTRPVNTIAAGSGITQLAAGESDIYALKSDGTVLAWGDNWNGQLGNGTKTSVTRPAPVTGLTDATQVAAGEQFALAIHIVPYLVGL
jgi:alpha-tubulin suppressor-like RCC1 family protein